MALKKDIEAKVEALVKPITDEHNFECVDVEYVKEGGNWTLRVFVDKEGGVTIEDCELVSRSLDIKLDEADPIPDAYMLEVSSPGIDRPLKKETDYERSIGKSVEIKLYKAVEGTKEYVGILDSFNKESVTITSDDQSMTFLRKDIAKIRLSVIF
jgi:ribosome maturation factor RimP